MKSEYLCFTEMKNNYFTQEFLSLKNIKTDQENFKVILWFIIAKNYEFITS